MFTAQNENQHYNMNAMKILYVEFNFMSLELVEEHKINIYIHWYSQKRILHNIQTLNCL